MSRTGYVISIVVHRQAGSLMCRLSESLDSNAEFEVVTRGPLLLSNVDLEHDSCDINIGTANLG